MIGQVAGGDRERAGALGALVARSPAAADAVRLARRAAGSTIAVLFEGESGVGKEVFARAVHADSARARAPFVAVNCGALPEALVESILFGHERGAFTGALERRAGKFAEADGGTLFLDEIGELPLMAQVKLLRALQEGEVDPVGAARPRAVDIRLMAATNRDLRAEVAAGRFREDLFYRISAFPVRLPPLRARREDMAPLAHLLLARLAAASGRPVPQITPSAMRLIESAPWPGNIRELENALHRAAVLAEGGPITPDTLRAPLPARPSPPAEPPAPFQTLQAQATPPEGAPTSAPPDTAPGAPFPTLAAVEAAHIRLAIGQCEGRISEAARRLGIGRSTLYRKLAELGLARDCRD